MNSSFSLLGQHGKADFNGLQVKLHRKVNEGAVPIDWSDRTTNYSVPPRRRWTCRKVQRNSQVHVKEDAKSMEWSMGLGSTTRAWGIPKSPTRIHWFHPFRIALWEADQGTPPESKGVVDSQRGSANRHCNVHNHCARSIRGVTKGISG